MVDEFDGRIDQDKLKVFLQSYDYHNNLSDLTYNFSTWSDFDSFGASIYDIRTHGLPFIVRIGEGFPPKRCMDYIPLDLQNVETILERVSSSDMYHNNFYDTLLLASLNDEAVHNAIYKSMGYHTEMKVYIWTFNHYLDMFHKMMEFRLDHLEQLEDSNILDYDDDLIILLLMGIDTNDDLKERITRLFGDEYLIMSKLAHIYRDSFWD